MKKAGVRVLSLMFMVTILRVACWGVTIKRTLIQWGPTTIFGDAFLAMWQKVSVSDPRVTRFNDSKRILMTQLPNLGPYNFQVHVIA